MAIINGNNNANFLQGTLFADKIDGKGGNDTILGRDGNDQLIGGSGADKILGGDGNDLLIGGLHNDNLIGGRGNDIVSGGSGNDILDPFGLSNNGDQVDTALGGTGADRFVLGEKFIGSFYTGNGVSYMEILDFKRSQGDKIQISGGISEYTLNPNFSSGTGLLKNGDLVAIIHDVTDLTATDFVSV